MYSPVQEEEKTRFEKFSGIFGSIGSFIFESVEAIVISLALCVVLYLVVVTPHEVVGRSMMPNFENGEYLIANKLVYRFGEPERGDVLIFKHSETQDLIKRVVGLPGDKVSLLDGRVYVNDKPLDESPYLADTVYTNGGNSLSEGESVTVPQGQYFVLGDNRPNSSDSRAFGPIEQEQIKGKAWIVYFPFNRFRIVEHVDYQI